MERRIRDHEKEAGGSLEQLQAAFAGSARRMGREGRDCRQAIATYEVVEHAHKLRSKKLNEVIEERGGEGGDGCGWLWMVPGLAGSGLWVDGCRPLWLHGHTRQAPPALPCNHLRYPCPHLPLPAPRPCCACLPCSCSS